jgi:molecular chaperone Hsp33
LEAVELFRSRARFALVRVWIMDSKTDHVLRAVTDDGAFRVIAVLTRETAAGAVEAQHARGSIAQTFAELVTATVLVRELMSPDHRVQGILTSADGQNRLVADANPDGSTRGLVQVEKGVTVFPMVFGARLQMMRSLRNGSLQQGVVEVPKGRGVASALMEYLQTSEQLVCTVAIGALLDGKGDGDESTVPKVRAAGGWVVQLLPEASRGPLAVMTDRLAALPDLEHLLKSGSGDPAVLLRDILQDMPYTRTAESTLRFGCSCSEQRVLTSLATIARADLESMVTAGEVLDVACDYCGKNYAVVPERLRALLAEN